MIVFLYVKQKAAYRVVLCDWFSKVFLSNLNEGGEGGGASERGLASLFNEI